MFRGVFIMSCPGKRSKRITPRCNHVCFNYMGISWLEIATALWPYMSSQPNVEAHVICYIFMGIKTQLCHPLNNCWFLWCSSFHLKSDELHHKVSLLCLSFLLLLQDSISISSDPLNNLSWPVCSLQQSWQSMYPQAKPNKLISQSPLYTLPPTKKLMAGTYNPSQNNYRDANCIQL